MIVEESPPWPLRGKLSTPQSEGPPHRIPFEAVLKQVYCNFTLEIP